MRDAKFHSTGEWPERPAFDAMPNFLKDAAEWRRFAPGEQLFKLGDRPQRMFYVAEGEARLRRYSPDGSEIVLQRAKFNFLAEASLESPVYHCDAVAIDPIRAILFPMPVFRKAIEECPAFRTIHADRPDSGLVNDPCGVRRILASQSIPQKSPEEAPLRETSNGSFAKTK